MADGSQYCRVFQKIVFQINGSLLVSFVLLHHGGIAEKVSKKGCNKLAVVLG